MKQGLFFIELNVLKCLLKSDKLSAMDKKFHSGAGLILYFMKGALFSFLLSGFFAALSSLFDMLLPKIVSFTVDSVIGSAVPSLPGAAAGLLKLAGGAEALRRTPLLIAAAVAVVGGLAAFSRYLFRVMNARGAECFVRNMRDGLFGRILSLPFSWFGEHSTGDIIQRCTSDVQTVKRFVSEQMTGLVRTIILIVMALTFMAGIDRRVMFATAIYIPVVIGYSCFFHNRIGRAFAKAEVEEGKLSAIAQENLTGVRVLRAFGRESYERERFERQNSTYTGFWVHLFRLMSAYWASGDLLTGFQNLTVLLYGTSLCVRGELSPGSFIALVSYNAMLIWPVRQLGRVISEMSKAGIAIGRIRDIMSAQPETDEEDAGEPPLDGDIVFENVTFSYPGRDTDPDGAEAPGRSMEAGRPDTPVLQDVSFTVRAGMTVGILGGTGSGKSTLMMLLTRMYSLEPGKGRITIGGEDIRRIRAAHLRRNIGFVIQEPFLFSRSLKENISISEKEADILRIRSAARTACVDDTILGFTAGYDTIVGERGVTLSGGQKQRVAIARMLIGRPPVMIFDDSLSAVDARTDARIRHALREDTKGATVFLVSHRITTLQHADLILVLDKGRLAQSGTHEELMRTEGIYRRVYNLQTAGRDA